MSNNKIKIGFVEIIGGHGGMELYDYGFCKSLYDNNFIPYLFTSNTSNLESNFPFHFDIYKCFINIYKPFNLFGRISRLFWGYCKLIFIAKRNNITILHINLFSLNIFELFFVLLFFAFNFKIVATIHDVQPLSNNNKKSSNYLLYFYNIFVLKFITHTSFSSNLLCKYFPKIKPKLSVVTQFDSDFVFNFNGSTQDARDLLSLNLPINSKVALFFGQIKDTKGLDVLIKAFSLLDIELRRNLYILIAGRPWKSSFKKYSDLIDSLGLSNNIIIHDNYIKNEDVPIYFASSDFVVLPYKIVYNSGVILRSMSYGTPILASNLEAFSDIIRDGETGLIFQNNCPIDLSRIMKHAILNPLDLYFFSKNSKILSNTKYSMNNIGEEMLEIYNSLA